jgi:hypothetical protein
MTVFELPTSDYALQVMHLIGDVKGKVAIMVDDMIDTAGWQSVLFPNFFWLYIFSVYSFQYSLFCINKTQGQSLVLQLC